MRCCQPCKHLGDVPRDRALWRIDPRTVKPSRIDMPYLPSCVAASADDIWVTVRRG